MELIFISNLYNINLSWDRLKLPNSGSDFQIDLPFIGEKNIEMKTRLKDFGPCEEPYEIWELSIPALLIYFAHSSSTKRASKKQKADIVFVNIAYCYGGHLFRHANPATKKGNLSFEYAFNGAIELVKNNKKAVIVFMELYSPFQVIAQTFDKKWFEKIWDFVCERKDELKEKKKGLEPTLIEIVREIDRITKNLPEK